MPKRKCTFNNSLKDQFPFIKDSSFDSTKVECTICRAEFSVAHGGRSDIVNHVKTKKHNAALSSSTCDNKLLATFLPHKQELGDKESELAAQEATFVYHTIKHNQSFQSMDCTSLLLKKFVDPRFTCKQTKCKAIAVNVLAPQAVYEISEELKKARFCCLAIDVSNSINKKVVPIVVRYFLSNKGIATEILELSSIPGETSDIVQHILKTAKKYEITGKIIGLSADNTNTNFGGFWRRGKNSILAELRGSLDRQIIGVGCAAHIVHNAVQTAVDILPIDFQAILGKIVQYFRTFTVRVEELENFCNFVGTEYDTVLGKSKTRWLSLEPALTRFIDMYEPLKSYFLSQDRCPHILFCFFNDRTSFIYLLFLKTQLKLFSQATMEIEKEDRTAFEVKHHINILIMKLAMRHSEVFLTSDVQAEMRSLVDEGVMTSDSFQTMVLQFYTTAMEYIREWSHEPLGMCAKMEWASLRVPFSWENIIESLGEIHAVFPDLQLIEENLFDDYCQLKSYATEEKMAEWNSANCSVADRWVEIFDHFNKEHLDYSCLEVVVSFCLTLPGSNATVDRIFSQINSLWTSERNSLSIETVKSMLTVKTHYKNLSCSEFFEQICKDCNLLKKTYSSVKYTRASSDELEASTSSASSQYHCEETAEEHKFEIK
ncbi:hypothetical protein BsWGS_21242 [Bradybaena similaris]